MLITSRFTFKERAATSIIRSKRLKRWGTQAPFSNITLDWTVPADLAEQNCIIGGKEVDFKYKYGCPHCDEQKQPHRHKFRITSNLL